MDRTSTNCSKYTEWFENKISILQTVFKSRHNYLHVVSEAVGTWSCLSSKDGEKESKLSAKGTCRQNKCHWSYCLKIRTGDIKIIQKHWMWHLLIANKDVSENRTKSFWYLRTFWGWFVFTSRMEELPSFPLWVPPSDFKLVELEKNFR